MLTCQLNGLEGGRKSRGVAALVAAAVFSTAISMAQPSAVSVSPSSGSGTTQTFTYVASSPNGSGYIEAVQMLLSWTVWGPGACWVDYVQSSNLLYLMNDQGTSWGTGVAPGTSGTLSNSQCQINTGSATASGSGNDLTVKLPITFLSGYLGLLQNWVVAYDNSGANSGWVELGTWTAYSASSQVPTVNSVTPSAGSGLAQTFQYSLSDVNGYKYIGAVLILFNSTYSGANGCYMWYYPSANYIYLYNNAGTSATGGYFGPSGGTLSNSQCSIDLAAASMSGSGNNLTFSLPVTFASSFSGTQNHYIEAEDHAQNYSSAGPYGTWTVGSVTTPPSAVSVNPPSGSGTSQTFTYVASSPNGSNYIEAVQMLLSWTVWGPGACWVDYVQTSNLLYLMNDEGTSWGTGIAPQASGTLSNSQCQINTAGVTVTGAAATLTINIPVTFEAGYLGLLQNWLLVYDDSGAISNWTEVGTWTAYTASSQLPTVNSISPSAGAGTAQTFTYSISDVNGYKYIGLVDIILNSSFSDANACFLQYWPSANYIYLFNNAGTSATSAYFGSSGTLSNSQCSIDLSAASMSGSGNNLSFSLPLTFTSSFDGPQNHYVQVADHAQNYTSGGPYGTWTVGQAVAAPTFSPAAGQYTSAQTVQISTATSGATIRYTTGSTMPSETTGTVYSGPITVSTSQTINAIAYESGWIDSPISSASYTINIGGTATYTVQTSPVGLSITVDGSNPLTAPQSFQWVPGSAHTVAVNGAVQAGTMGGVQYGYANWSDLGGQSHSIVAPAGGGTYTANFTTQYYLTMTPPPNYLPTETAEGTVYPSSGWYNAGSAVQLSAIPAKNYVFTGFSITGGINGASPYVFTINQPTTVTSNFAVAQLLVTSQNPLPSAKVGVPYSVQLTATGGIPFNTGTTTFYEWHVEGNTTIPPPFTFSSSGVLSGTPTTAGTFGNVFLYAQDSQGTQAPFQPTFTISANDTPLTATCTPSASTVSLGQSFTFTANVSGGTPGYTYSWTSLSTGASLGTTQAITLRASVLGPLIAVLSVHDSAAGNGSASCSVTVQPATTTAATMLSPTSGSTLTGSSATFQWGNAVGVSQYSLMIGSTQGGSDLYNANTGLTDYAIVTGLPTDGRTLYLTLSSFIAGSWTANTYTYSASSTPSSLMIVPAPYNETLAAPTPASFTITVSSNAGFSGAVSLTASGVPAGATFSFNPSTLNGSGSSDLTITPAMNSPTGTFPVVVTASNSSQSVLTVATLNLVTPAPATLLGPNSAMVTGGVPTTFTWNAGLGATAYQLSIGTSAGASNILSQYTDATQSQVVELPCGISGPVFVLVGSYIGGTWQNEGYQYSYCDCGTGGGGGGVPSVQPAIRLISSEPAILNSGQQSQTGTFQVYDSNTGDLLSASNVSDPNTNCEAPCHFEWNGVDLSPSAILVPSGSSGSNFTVQFSATSQTTPGQYQLTVAYNGTNSAPATLPLNNAVQVYDATPVITSLNPPAIPPGQSNQTLKIFGTNLGSAPGSITICPHGETCSTSDVQVVTLGSPCGSSGQTLQWCDNEVDISVSTPSSPMAPSGLYDIVLTSGGESPVSLGGTGFLADQGTQTSSPQSNAGKLTIPQIQVTSNGAQISSGQTVYISPTGVGPSIAASVPNAPATDNATFALTVAFPQILPAQAPTTCSPSLVQIVSQGYPYGPQQPQQANLSYPFGAVVPGTGITSTSSYNGQSPLPNATITWTYSSGGGAPQTMAPFTFSILGQNPNSSQAGTAALSSALNNVLINSTPLWFAPNVANHETNENQFYAGGTDSTTSGTCGSNIPAPLKGQIVGAPYFGQPGGYGMMQLDPPASPADLWSWPTFISDWQALVQALAGPQTNGSGSTAYQFWIRQVTQWQTWNLVTNPNQPVPWVTDSSQTYQNCSFAPPTLNAPTVRTTTPPYWYGDAVLMKQIAGAPQNYVVWQNLNNPPPGSVCVANGSTPSSTNPCWEFYKPNSVSPDIVYGFCTCGSSVPAQGTCVAGY
jgi:Chitobiase/beta-hexosaminidase C-terminal domain